MTDREDWESERGSGEPPEEYTAVEERPPTSEAPPQPLPTPAPGKAAPLMPPGAAPSKGPPPAASARNSHHRPTAEASR